MWVNIMMLNIFRICRAAVSGGLKKCINSPPQTCGVVAGAAYAVCDVRIHERSTAQTPVPPGVLVGVFRGRRICYRLCGTKVRTWWGFGPTICTVGIRSAVGRCLIRAYKLTQTQGLL